MEIEMRSRTAAMLYRAFGGGSSVEFSTIAVRANARGIEFFGMDDTSSIIAHFWFNPTLRIQPKDRNEAVFAASPVKKALHVAQGFLGEPDRKLALRFADPAASFEVRQGKTVVLRRTVAKEAEPIMLKEPLEAAPKDGTTVRLEDCRAFRAGFDAIRDLAFDGLFELAPGTNQLAVRALPRPQENFFTCTADIKGKPNKQRLGTLPLDLVAQAGAGTDPGVLSILLPSRPGPILARYNHADGEITFLLAQPADA